MAIYIWDDQGDREFTAALAVSGIGGRGVRLPEELPEDWPAASLVVMHQDLARRAPVVRRLLDARVSFAIHGLPGPDGIDRGRLAARIRRRHVRACWLGGLRFLPGVFRLKELLNSGVFGEMRLCAFSGTDSAPDSFERFRQRDLQDWLLPEPPPECRQAPAPAAAGEYFLRVEGTAGEVDWRYRKGRGAVLAWRLSTRRRQEILPDGNPLAIELGLLRFLVDNGLPWHSLPPIAPPRCCAPAGDPGS